MHWIAGMDGLPPQARLELLERMGVPHAIFGRLGGHSQPPFASLNTGHTVGDAPEAVEANMARICQALGVAQEDLVTAHLVHGTRVAVVGPRDRGRVVPATDAL
ncbi:MAG: laccase domain-containing protein, partial [Anaerolineae bacterium]|nr:laccase domain-containing protein [Anaerolineae bacterium]